MSLFFQGKSNKKHVSLTEQSTLLCKQWRFLCESQFCLASRNSTGIKLERPIRSLGLVRSGMNPEVSASSSHNRTRTTAISQRFSFSRTQRFDSHSQATSWTDLLAELKLENLKWLCQPSAVLLAKSAGPPLMTEPVSITDYYKKSFEHANEMKSLPIHCS